MSTYHFKGKCKNNQVEVITSKPEVLERELDRYLEAFLGTKVSKAPAQKPQQTEQHEPEDFFKDTFQSHLKTQSVPEENIEEEIISLADFLFSNDSTDLFDEFIASAYYFKKILKQNSFTLKFLNSKFYPATNRLIDFSIVEEAKNRGFIDNWEEEGATRYSLSENGEMFFLNQING